MSFDLLWMIYESNMLYLYNFVFVWNGGSLDIIFLLFLINVDYGFRDIFIIENLIECIGC